MMKAVALTAAVAVVAVGLTRVAAADDDVAGVAVKYGSCGTERYKCGTDYSRCSTKYGVCLRYGCKRDLTYACEKTESYDCDKTVYESYTKSVRKTRGCDKKVDEECTKYRKVSYTCSKQREETCTRRKHKTCYKSWRTESYTCTKTEQKEVSCSNGRTYGYDGKKCYKSHSYEGTCSKQVGVGGYDCGVEERYTCTKSYDATCHKDEAYTATCTVVKWATCEYYEDVKAQRPVTKWVKNGCSRTVSGRCKSGEKYDDKCCAERGDKKVCEDKWCTRSKC
ncbi:hypothetical protein I4F81_002712 [Pyropia yezoensis]|uniref:Uncharacterized protein n=1 Tax=Pyropia yezoensis TaxID=2788 RepID=A0ACC3BQD5_PYRYE|nr:hypothetical protein I4F81_002712 [Neopyropia yezoensis]